MFKKATPISHFLILQVSKLARFETCPKRCKLELFNEIPFSQNSIKSQHAMSLGTKLHASYSLPYGSFDRLRLRTLIQKAYGEILQKTLVFDEISTEVLIRGIYDDLRVDFNSETKEKTVSILEIKTTSQPRLTTWEIKSAVFQLQLYIYLLKPLIEKFGYKLHAQHYVEIYSQKTGNLLQQIPVYENLYIEDSIKNIVYTFLGLQALSYPPLYVCKRCPKPVKILCGRVKHEHN